MPEPVFSLVGFDEDREVITVRYPEPPPTRLTTEAVEQEIAYLGYLRAELKPSVAPRWTGGTYVCKREPAFAVELSILGEVIIHIRDDRFGWLHYIASYDHARDFAEAIFRMLGRKPPKVGSV